MAWGRVDVCDMGGFARGLSCDQPSLEKDRDIAPYIYLLDCNVFSGEYRMDIFPSGFSRVCNKYAKRDVRNEWSERIGFVT